MQSAVMEIEGLRKHYRGRRVLESVSFTMCPGECVGIVGANGCGKTTLLSIVAGVLKPETGSIRYQGKELLRPGRKNFDCIAYVPQENPLFEELSVLDNLLFWYQGNRRKLEQDLQTGAPGVLGMEKELHTAAGKLSGGMKKRLSISCALAGDAPVIVLDEPGASLDLVCKTTVWGYLDQYKKAGGMILLTSHEMQELEHCDKIYILKNGMLAETQTGLSAQQLISQFI